MHKYCKKRNNRKAQILLAFIVTLCIIVVSVYSYFSVRQVILSTARKSASTMSFNLANQAISEQMDNGAIKYSDIVKLTKNEQQSITALEIDIIKINKLKSDISSQIIEKVVNSNEYIVGIPVGTLFGNEYTLGFGPIINFKMQMSANVITDFESRFYSAGINQVLHQIVIKVKINGGFVLPWNHSGFSTETSVIAAETVLVGLTPEAYTSVIENYGSDADDSRTIDDIFDYGADRN